LPVNFAPKQKNTSYMEQTGSQASKSNKMRAYERLKGKYPNENFDDEETFYGKINDDFDDYDGQINGYKEREKSLIDMFNADPRSAAFLTSWHKGEDPAVQLVRMFGSEIRDAIDDPEKQEEMAAANKSFLERVAKNKELEEQYQENIGKSLDTLDKYQEENGLSDEETDDIMAFLANVIGDGIIGKFSEESMEMARKALTHDADVANADVEGETRGRNAQIEERLRKKEKGDGTPQLVGRNSGGARRRAMPNLGALDNFSDSNQTIWERGGEKRIKNDRK